MYKKTAAYYLKNTVKKYANNKKELYDKVTELKDELRYR